MFFPSSSSRSTTDGAFPYPRRFYASSEEYAPRKGDLALLFVFICTIVFLLVVFARSFPERQHIYAHLPSGPVDESRPAQRALAATPTQPGTKRVAPHRPRDTVPVARPRQLVPGITEDAWYATDANSTGHADTTAAETRPRNYPASIREQTSSSKHSAHVCHGIGCKELADELHGLLDDRIDPCSDFYQHVCGKWLESHKPSPGSALASPQTLRLRKLERVLLTEMKKEMDEGSLKQLLKLWRFCRDKAGGHDSLKSFQMILRAYGLDGFPYKSNKTRDVSVTAAKVLVHAGIPALADVAITKSVLKPGTPAQLAVTIGPPKPLFRGFVRMPEVHTEWFYSAVERSGRLQDVPQLFQLEQALVKLAGESTGVKNYVATPVSQLMSSRHWNWRAFLERVFSGLLDVRDDTLVLVKGHAFHRNLVALIERFGPGTVLNYLAFRVYVRYSLFLNFDDFMELVLLAGARLPGWEDGDSAKQAADLRCLRALSKTLPEPFAYVYWNAQLRSRRSVKDATDALVEDVIGEVASRARYDLNLTSRVTNRFRDDIFNLRRQIFVPDWLKEPRLRDHYSHLLFGHGMHSPVLTWQGAIESLVLNNFRQLSNRSFETFWRGPPLREGPWIDFDHGYVGVPPAAVDKDFTKDAFMVHHIPRLGLDLAKQVFAHLTDLDRELGPATYVPHLRLELLASCLQRQFYGNRSSSEVSARDDAWDLLAIPVALEVFRQNAAHGNERFKFRDSRAYSTDQLFFYEFALDRCESYDEQYFHERLHHGVRSPAPYSVNGPLRNLPLFAEAFGCVRGMPMRRKNVCTF
ncbi:neprilysin-2-like [Haemaphysalis longicornis]